MEESASQLSAMFDGELSAAECELLSRRLARDEALRGRWARYALIGASLRSEPIATVSGGFARRVGAAIDRQEDEARPQPAVRGFRRLRGVALGGSLAAGVAVAAVLVLRTEILDRGVVAPVAVAHPATAAAQPALALVGPASSMLAAQAGAGGEPASYVVPPGAFAASRPVPASLANYVVAHSEFSSPLARRGLLSALAAGDATRSVDAGPAVVIVDEGSEAGH